MSDAKILQYEGDIGYRAMFHHATVGIVVVDDDGRILLANPFIEKNFGFTTAELTGRPVEILIPSAMREKHVERRDQYFAHPKNRPMGYGLELFARRKDGTEFPVEISLSHYEQDGSRLAVAYITDVTKRKAAEEHAKQTEREYRAIFEGIHESFMLQQIVRNSENQIVDLLFLDVNKATEQLIARPRNEIIGQLRSHFFGELDDEVIQVLERVEKGELVRYEQYFKPLDRWFDRRFYLHKPGQLVTLSIDITKEKKDEALLQESRNLLEMETASLSLLNDVGTRLGRVNDLEEGLRQILDAAIELMGAAKGNIQLFDPEKNALSIVCQKGLPEAFLSFFNTVSAENGSVCGWALKERRQVMVEDTELDPPSQEFREIARKSGFRAVQSTPMLGQGGVTMGMISTHFQAAQKFRPQDLQKMSLLAQKAESFVERCLAVRELEEKVRLRTTELAQALEKQKELSELKSRFLSIASHEFRTPLTTILSSTALIESYNKPEQQANRQRHIGKIKQSVKNLNDVLGEFLSFEKLEQGKVEIMPAPLNFRQLCADIVEELSDVLKKGQAIRMYYNCRDTITHDKNILRSLLMNLLSNAIKYSGEQKNIHLTLDSHNGLLLIAVEDEGIGIPEPEQPFLFGNFYRAKNAVGIQGTGLGLNIVKRYVELMDGKIFFTSQLNKGTTFFVQLPFDI